MKTISHPEFVLLPGLHARFAIAIFGLLAVFLFLPKISDAATIYASPASGNFNVGSSFSVSIRTNTQGAAVNTAEASIAYSADTLELVSVKQGATFYLAAPGSPTKSSGTAYFGGGVPSPGYNGTAGTIGTATFRARAAGTGTVTISSGSVLLNDGSGTNALTSSSGGSFKIAAAAAYATPATVPAGALAVAVTSTTHPEQDISYNKPDVTLNWDRPVGAFGFSFELDQNPETVPDNTLDTTVTTTKSYPGLKDGVWYFHIKARGQAASAAFGPVTHYKIQVDTSIPKPELPVPVTVPGPVAPGFFQRNVQIPLYILVLLILLIAVLSGCLIWHVTKSNKRRR